MHVLFSRNRSRDVLYRQQGVSQPNCQRRTFRTLLSALAIDVSRPKKGAGGNSPTMRTATIAFISSLSLWKIHHITRLSLLRCVLLFRVIISLYPRQRLSMLNPMSDWRKGIAR